MTRARFNKEEEEPMGAAIVKYKGDSLFEATSGKQKIQIDLPAPMGGKDRGMTPTELFAVSLAACINALVVNYCRDMKIKHDGIVVTLEYDKLDQPARLGNFKAHIKMPAKDWETRKDGILRAAERCPVHETIHYHKGLTIEVE